jgi:putative integral membrane protein (TIGR02587 family)
MDARDTLGTIITQGLMIAIGVSVGTAQISEGPHEQGGPQGRHLTLVSEIVLAVCGTVLVAANAAPTEEIVLLAGRMTAGHLLGVMALSFALAAMLLYHSGFTGTARFAGSGRTDVLHGATITYAAALASSAGLLWFFRRFDQAAPHLVIAQCIVLGLPGTLGAAIGRLLLR